MSVKIKVCGMRDSQNIMEVANLKPDFMGFIFYSKSPRFVGEDFVMPSIDSSIERVGVFVNHDFDFITRQSKNYSLSHAQLHGDESPQLCNQLKLIGLKVIKVFSVGVDFNFEVAKPYEPFVDYFLFDTKGDNYGGTGRTFDWSLLENYSLTTPFFLSGGLNPENTSQIHSISSTGFFAVDLNSGVEESPGVKSISRLKSVFQELNQG